MVEQQLVAELPDDVEDELGLCGYAGGNEADTAAGNWNCSLPEHPGVATDMVTDTAVLVHQLVDEAHEQ